MKRRTLVLIVAGGAGLVLAMVLVAVSAAYGAHYRDRGLPGITVAGEPITGKTRAEVAESLRARAAATSVTWSTGPGSPSASATLADLGVSVDVDATVREAFSRNSSLGGQLSALFVPDRIDAVVTSDGKTLEATARQIAVDSGVAGSDAVVVLSDDGTTFEVTPAVVGKAVNPATFQQEVKAAAAGLKKRSITVEFVDAAPMVSDEDAAKAAQAANALVTLPVVVSDGNKDHTAEPTVQAAWIGVPVTKAGLGTPTLDVDQVTAWVQDLADGARRDPVNGKRYVDPKGEVLSVTQQPRDGQEVTNVETVTEAIIAQVGAGKSYTGAFEYTKVPAAWESKEVSSAAEVLVYFPTGKEKWIDVNLANHTVTLYEGTTVVKGPISMVDGAAVTPTVTGTYKIYAKYETKTMRGFEADGVTPYVTENVPWSMFFHGGYALHGAYWRSTFGYSASHGCVNLPVSTAKEIYQWAPIGTVVVVHRG
ncbi:MAG: L,D-transpeptidase/peptidoglycan binding protein [Micrococcales bacterium]|nr:L,D-transpeptidase/peptidoglycan binding protein [Micrococcales bacterium]MCL2667000.1 L,D-transpeptidase/peptidoglycan binding protein [Micrococcales bacterium]